MYPENKTFNPEQLYIFHSNSASKLNNKTSNDKTVFRMFLVSNI